MIIKTRSGFHSFWGMGCFTMIDPGGEWWEQQRLAGLVAQGKGQRNIPREWCDSDCSKRLFEPFLPMLSPFHPNLFSRFLDQWEEKNSRRNIRYGACLVSHSAFLRSYSKRYRQVATHSGPEHCWAKIFLGSLVCIAIPCCLLCVTLKCLI